MNWMLGGLAFAACVICGLLGLTAGINLNPASTVSYIPNWGSLGDWVSGIGALLAVISSFALVRRNELHQAEREKEIISVDQYASEEGFAVRVISLGVLPCSIRGVYFKDSGGRGVSLTDLLPSSHQQKRALPYRLERRQDIELGWDWAQADGILDEISNLELSSLGELVIEITTVTASYEFPISSELHRQILARAEAISMRIEGY